MTSRIHCPVRNNGSELCVNARVVSKDTQERVRGLASENWGLWGHEMREALPFPVCALLCYLKVFDVCLTVSIFKTTATKKSYVFLFLFLKKLDCAH